MASEGTSTFIKKIILEVPISGKKFLGSTARSMCTTSKLFLFLRLGAASKEAYHEDTYPNILHRYLKFDDEMSVISVMWRDCQQLLDNYNDEQVRI